MLDNEWFRTDGNDQDSFSNGINLLFFLTMEDYGGDKTKHDKENETEEKKKKEQLLHE